MATKSNAKNDERFCNLLKKLETSKSRLAKFVKKLNNNEDEKIMKQIAKRNGMRKIVAIHEAGHAVVALLNNEKVRKVTIKYMGDNCFGYTDIIRNIILWKKKDVMEDIVVTMGGMAAEKILCGAYTTASEDDIEDATIMANKLITEIGMDKDIGIISLKNVNDGELSERTKEIVEEKIRQIIKDCVRQSEEIIRSNQELVKVITRKLLEKEELNEKEVMKLYKNYCSMKK